MDVRRSPLPADLEDERPAGLFRWLAVVLVVLAAAVALLALMPASGYASPGATADAPGFSECSQITAKADKKLCKAGVTPSVPASIWGFPVEITAGAQSAGSALCPSGTVAGTITLTAVDTETGAPVLDPLPLDLVLAALDSEGQAFAVTNTGDRTLTVTASAECGTAPAV